MATNVLTFTFAYEPQRRLGPSHLLSHMLEGHAYTLSPTTTLPPALRTGIDYFGRRYHRPARDIIFRRNVIGTGCARLSDTSGYKSAQTFSTTTTKICICTRLQPPGFGYSPHSHRLHASRHGITIGSETSGSVFNVTFEDIRMDRTGTGQYGRGGILGCKVD